MIVTYLILFAILLASPALWFRWWHFSRFSAYAWGMLVFMACFGVVYMGFGEVVWGHTIGLFVFVLILSVAKRMHARKRADEAAETE
ncbi:MAG: hypothetical protein LAT62_03425 [Natronospirillum sp.]|uniref:hypothetical protein n=1 Tax=Natronospirillum sp. TaxID=2812955 RepID=UPI0025FD5194|nr:hypothetical protein [Natronospirillum sp.]MCH8550961.1 hypothetical protein [Natronospirillum sp.]